MASSKSQNAKTAFQARRIGENSKWERYGKMGISVGNALVEMKNHKCELSRPGAWSLGLAN
jgi:hypothetical protein